MGSSVPIWVEVEVPIKFWRKSYGVTGSEALDNAEIGVGERLTGRYTYNVKETDE